jgi:hypothetical protein
MRLLARILVVGIAMACTQCSASATDCTKMCVRPDAVPPTDSCVQIHEENRCVQSCAKDSDCDDSAYSGCTAKSDDGSRICAERKSTKSNQDAGSN